MMNRKKDFVIVGFIIGVFLIGFIIQNLIKKNNRSFIIRDFGVTVGMFDDFKEVGAENNPYLTYKYVVNGNVYYRTIMPKENLYYCEDNNCIGKKWRVIYSKEKPSKSMIDLSVEISKVDSSVKIKYFNNFE